MKISDFIAEFIVVVCWCRGWSPYSATNRCVSYFSDLGVICFKQQKSMSTNLVGTGSVAQFTC